MLGGVSSYLNSGFLLALLLTGFTPLLVLKTSMPYLLPAVAAVLPLLFLGLSLLLEGYSLRNILVAGFEMLMWATNILLLGFDLVPLYIGALLVAGVAVLVVIAEAGYSRMAWGWAQ